MENNDNRKTLILSVIGILVLVIAVVGVSFAMFTFTGTGTNENVIKTGTIKMEFTDDTKDNHIEISNKYPMSDAVGVAQTDNKANFDVTSSWGSSAMTINYDLGISGIVNGDTLTSEYVKVALLDGDGKVIVGTSDGDGKLTGGVKISSLSGTAGPNNIITTYGLTGGTMTESGTTDSYTLIAYVSEDYKLSIDKDNTDTENHGDAVIEQEDGSAIHKIQTKSETYKFKLIIEARQA